MSCLLHDQDVFSTTEVKLPFGGVRKVRVCDMLLRSDLHSHPPLAMKRPGVFMWVGSELGELSQSGAECFRKA